MIDPRIPLALGDEVDQLRAEINEQARLLGISAEKELALRAENERLKAELAEAKKDADLWRDLLSHQKFNNVSAVGYAINRAKERQAMKGK